MSGTTQLVYALQDLGCEVAREDGALLVHSTLEHPFRIEGNGSPHGLRLLSRVSVPDIPFNDRDAIASQQISSVRPRSIPARMRMPNPPLIALPPVRKASPKQDLSSY